MGQGASILDAPEYLFQKFQPNYNYVKTLGTTKNSTTFMCATEKEGHAVAKILLAEHTRNDMNLKNTMMDTRQMLDLRREPNVLPTVWKENAMESGERFYISYRQFVYHSLKEKLESSIPKLHFAEKMWLAYQALCSLCQIHQSDYREGERRNLIHGDIKPENLMITSANQLFLTDMVSFKPTYLRSNDLVNYNLFFGEMDNNMRCYFAPERFVDPEHFVQGSERNPLEPSMDIFSMGCVIAEIFMDGNTLFQLSHLQSYRKGQYDPRPDLMRKIGDPDVVELILRMISLDPAARPSASECIRSWSSTVMPLSFNKTLFQLNSCFVLPFYLYSDLRVSVIRKYMPSLFKLCFDSKLTTSEIQARFYEPMERSVFEQIRDDGIMHHIERQATMPVSEFAQFLDVSNEEAPAELQNFAIRDIDKESILIVIHWIGTFLPTCFFPQTRRCGLEMLLEIGKMSSLEIRLQYILPYVFRMFDDKQPKVIVKAMEVAVLLFENLLDSEQDYVLSNTDLKVFLSYIMPHFTRVQKLHTDSSIVQITYTKYLPMLAQIGRRFAEISTKSRLSHEKEDKQAAEGPNQTTQAQKTLTSANYDQELGALRKIFAPIISDTAGRQRPEDTPILRILYANLGRLCDFFGPKLTMDTLIPFIGTVPNNRDFLIRLSGLESVVGVGIKVGSQTLKNCLLLSYSQFLSDPEEMVVCKAIRTFTQLLQLRLISKSSLLEEFVMGSFSQEALLDRILPYLLHPNTQIREAAMQFVLTLSDHENTEVLSKAEVFCFIRNKLKPYLRNPISALAILMNPSQQEAKDLLGELQDPPSREVYDSMVKADQARFDNQQSLKQTSADKNALDKLNKIIINAQRKYTELRTDQVKRPSTVVKIRRPYSLNRVISRKSLSEISKQPLEEWRGGPQQRHHMNTEDFYPEFYEPCRVLAASEVEGSNRGLNTTTSYVSEIDYLCRALKLLPEDFALDESKQVMAKLANQSLPDSSILQLENLEDTAQPNSIPQFHPKHSKIGQIKVEAGSTFTEKNLFGEIRKTFEGQHRFQGRLVTTLYDHKSPVTSLSVSEDQAMLLSASHDDGEVRVWSTKDFDFEPSAGSLFKIDTGSSVNGVSFLQNTDYIAAAGGQGDTGIVKIYEQQRVRHGSNRHGGYPNANLPNHYNPLKEIEFDSRYGEVVTCMNTTLPISHQDLLVMGTQKGSMSIHDIRCKTNVLRQEDAFGMPKGMLTCCAQGQDAYQLMFGSVGGYVMIYDLRYNLVSTTYKHSHCYPVTSLACFKPRNLPNLSFNRSAPSSPFALVSAGGPQYEVSLLNLENGNIEYLLSSDDDSQSSSQSSGTIFPSYYRESMIRDAFNWPEKAETNLSLHNRHQQFTKSLINTSQIKLIQTLNDDQFSSIKDRYRLVKQAKESKMLCRKIVVPRLCSSMLQGSTTSDFAITAGNDMRIRYWNLKDPTGGSYFVNTPANDECEYVSETVGGGIQYIREKINKSRSFPSIDSNSLSDAAQASVRQAAGQAMTIPGTCIQMSSDSIYYNILANLIKQNYESQIDSGQLMNIHSARKALTQSIDSGFMQSNQFSIETGKDRVIVTNFNGLSEYQHLNGLCMNQRIQKDMSYDKWSAQQQNKSKGRSGKKDASSQVSQEPSKDAGNDYLFRESFNVSHQDAILDMAVLEIDGSAQRMNGSAVSSNDRVLPLLVTSGRDCTVKLWR